MRKLPPSIPEEEVRQLVQTASGGRFSWFSFVQGKTRCANIHSKLILMQNMPHVPMCHVFLHMARDGVQRVQMVSIWQRNLTNISRRSIMLASKQPVLPSATHAIIAHGGDNLAKVEARQKLCPAVGRRLCAQGAIWPLQILTTS